MIALADLSTRGMGKVDLWLIMLLSPSELIPESIKVAAKARNQKIADGKIP